MQLHTQKQLRRILKNVKSIFKELEFVDVEAKEVDKVEVGQLREFWIGYPLFGMVVKEDWKDMFWVVPFAIDVEFAHKSSPFIALEEKSTLLAGFPFWVYMTKEFLEKFSVTVERFSDEEIEKVLEWAEKFKFEELDNLQEEYVRMLMRVFARVNVANILQGIEKMEQEVRDGDKKSEKEQ